MSKALKSCTKSNQSPNLVTLVVLLKNGLFTSPFIFIFVFSTGNSKHEQYKIWPITWFELWLLSGRLSSRLSWFQVYICEMEETNISKLASGNVHKRTAVEIAKLFKDWDPTPTHFNVLDVKTFLQDKVNANNCKIIYSTWFLSNTFCLLWTNINGRLDCLLL